MKDNNGTEEESSVETSVYISRIEGRWHHRRASRAAKRQDLPTDARGLKDFAEKAERIGKEKEKVIQQAAEKREARLVHDTMLRSSGIND